jgi:hypothetical protein
VNAAGTVRFRFGPANLPAIHGQRDRACLTGPFYLRYYFNAVPAGFERRLASSGVLFDDHHIVLVNEVAFVHVARQTASCATHRVKHTTGAVADFEINGDAGALTPDPRGCELRHPPGILAESQLARRLTDPGVSQGMKGPQVQAIQPSWQIAREPFPTV